MRVYQGTSIAVPEYENEAQARRARGKGEVRDYYTILVGGKPRFFDDGGELRENGPLLGTVEVPDPPRGDREAYDVDLDPLEINPKATNPKDAAAVKRLPLHLIPPIAEFWLAMGLYEGAWKYGAKNWRTTGVKASVYASAALRHLTKYALGETHDPVSGVHHLGNVMACCAILLDADHQGVLENDLAANESDANFARDMGPWAESVMDQIQKAFPRAE